MVKKRYNNMVPDKMVYDVDDDKILVIFTVFLYKPLCCMFYRKLFRCTGRQSSQDYDNVRSD